MYARVQPTSAAWPQLQESTDQSNVCRIQDLRPVPQHLHGWVCAVNVCSLIPQAGKSLAL